MLQNDSPTWESALKAYGSSAVRWLRKTPQRNDVWRRTWKGFAAAAGASLTGPATASTMIHHVVPPEAFHATITEGDVALIDLDGQLSFEMVLDAGLQSASLGYLYYGVAQGLDDVRIVAQGTFAGRFLVHRYEPGELISPFDATGGSIVRGSQRRLGQTKTSHGNWDVSDTGYAGFVLGIGGPAPKAGWIKIRTEGVDNRFRGLSVLEWAFRTEPNVPIAAGATNIGSTLLGDYDGNGSVGPEDYAIWRSGFGKSVVPGSGGDGNDDGKIDAIDYVLWRDNLGATSEAADGGSESAIPEPASITLGVLALGAAGVLALKQRGRRDDR